MVTSAIVYAKKPKYPRRKKKPAVDIGPRIVSAKSPKQIEKDRRIRRLREQAGYLDSLKGDG